MCLTTYAFKIIKTYVFSKMGQICFICFIFQRWFDVKVCIKNILLRMHCKNRRFSSGIFREKSVSFLKHKNPTLFYFLQKLGEIFFFEKIMVTKKCVRKKSPDHNFFFSHKNLFSKTIFDFSFLDIFKNIC